LETAPAIPQIELNFTFVAVDVSRRSRRLQLYN
jgi:hypothetical protein